MKFNDYIIREIEQLFKGLIKKPMLDHHFFQTPINPLIKEVSKVSYKESNYAVGPLTKTIFVEDVSGNRYKVSVEDLKNVKGFAWITHKEADKLHLVYNREEGRYHAS